MNANHNGDGRLDEAALTRLVNEYFTAVPGGGADLDGRPGAPPPEPPPSEPAPPEVTLLSTEPPPAPPVTGPATPAAGLPRNDGLAALAAEAIRAAEALASAPFLPKQPPGPEQAAPASTRSEWDLRVRIALPTADPAVPTAGPVIPMADAGSAPGSAHTPAGGQAFYFIGPAGAAGPASAAQTAAPSAPVTAPTLVTQPGLDTPVSLSPLAGRWQHDPERHLRADVLPAAAGPL